MVDGAGGGWMDDGWRRWRARRVAARRRGEEQEEDTPGTRGHLRADAAVGCDQLVLLSGRIFTIITSSSSRDRQQQQPRVATSVSDGQLRSS